MDNGLTIHFLDVNGGDAIWIENKTSGRLEHILIDGGFGGSYKHGFRHIIKQAFEKGENIRLWIITHIDQDHIGSAIAFFKDNTLSARSSYVSEFWFNHSGADIGQIESTISIKQGIDLREYLKEINLLNDKPILAGHEYWLKEVKLTVLSPSVEKYKKANEGWAEVEFQQEISSNNDYNERIETLIGKPFVEDNNIPNGSSISILLEYQDKKLLFLADSHPSDIQQTLETMGYGPDHKIKIDFFKVSHHGSRYNTSPALLEMIECYSFIFCANGRSHGHPDKELLSRIITSPQRNIRKKIHFIFTADTSELRDIFKIDLDAQERYNFDCTFADNHAFSYAVDI